MAIRWALMKSHYRSDRMWSEQLLVDAENDLAKLKEVLATGLGAESDTLIQAIIDSLSDDLNTPKALDAINTWVIESKTTVNKVDTNNLAIALDCLLGLKL